jgi:hypothetical protein
VTQLSGFIIIENDLVPICVEGWVGPRSGMDGCANAGPTGIRSPDVHPVARRYTDYVIMASIRNKQINK